MNESKYKNVRTSCEEMICAPDQCNHGSGKLGFYGRILGFGKIVLEK